MFNNFSIGVGRIIQYLHFRTGMIGFLEFRSFLYVKQNTAVTGRRNFPFQFQIEIVIFIVCYEVAAANDLTVFFIGCIKVYCTIAYLPGRSIGFIIEYMKIAF